MYDVPVQRARRRALAVTAATVTAATGTAVLLAGCAGRSASGSVISCVQFGVDAIRRHVVVTALPAACRGLNQGEVNLAVNRALRAAAATSHGKVAQRKLIGQNGPYLAHLIHAVPAAGPPAAAPLSGPPSHVALSLAALAAWLITIGLGTTMMARWITRVWRSGAPPWRGRWPALNIVHFGLAVVSLATWIGYLATGTSGLAWAACALLVPTVGLGMTLVFLGRPSSRRPNVFVVATHIGAAFATILLAVLAAAGSG